MRQAVSSMAVWLSWPQACMTPGTAEAKSHSFSSCIGSASISARRSTVLPGFLPPMKPTVPYFTLVVKGMPISVSFSRTYLAVFSS